MRINISLQLLFVGLVLCCACNKNESLLSSFESNKKMKVLPTMPKTYADNNHYATFSIDTTRLKRFFKDGEWKLPSYLTEQVWYVNGQEMKYPTSTIKVKVNPFSLDTILYKGFRRSSFDTIICNVAEAKQYQFVYNECCGAFNLKESNWQSGFIEGKVLYKTDPPDGNTYLGSLGEVSIVIQDGNSDTLTVACRSAMSPNIYPLSFSEIQPCYSDSTCTETPFCLHKAKEGDAPFYYTTIAKKLNFLYLPLSEDPLQITYHSKADSFSIR